MMRLLGLVRWDDFIVCDAAARTYRVATVPLDRQFMKPFALPSDLSVLKPDTRLPDASSGGISNTAL
jgi:hypothetical protein